MEKRFGKFLRLGGTAFFATILCLSGVLSLFDPIGFFTPTETKAAAGQTALAHQALTFRKSDKAFLATGENLGAGGTFVQNQNSPAQCVSAGQTIQYLIPASGQKERITTDGNGNIYVVWHQGYGGIAIVLFFARISADCTVSTGAVPLGYLLSPKFGSNSNTGNPDIAYSPFDKRLYMSVEVFPKTLWYFSAPTVDGAGNPITTGWDTAANWDRGAYLAAGSVVELVTRIAADQYGRVHIIFTRGDWPTLQVVDLINGINGTWNSYGGAGLDISQLGAAGSTNFVRTHTVSVTKDGTAYAVWNRSRAADAISIARFDPNTNAWTKLGDNIIGTSYLDFNSIWTVGGVAGLNGNVYIAIGTNNNLNYGCSSVYESTNRGANFSRIYQKCYSSANATFNVSEVSIAQGDNRVGVFSTDSDRNSDFYEIAGKGGTDYVKLVTTVNPIVPANVTLATGQNPYPLQISWSKLAGGNGTPVSYYINYYNSANPGAGWQPINQISSITYPTAALSGSVNLPMVTTYPSTFSFISWASDSDPSDNEVAHTAADTSITLTYPPISTSMTALSPIITTTTVTLNWNGTGGMTSLLNYTLKYQDGNSGAWTPCATTTLKTLTFPTGCSPSFQMVTGHRYNFLVSASDGNAAVTYNPPAAQTTTHVIVPLASSMVAFAPMTAPPVNNLLTVSWIGSGGDVNATPIYPGQSASILYTVDYWDITNPAGSWNSLVASLPATSANLTVVPGHTYQFRLKATDGITTIPFVLPYNTITTILTGVGVGTVYNGCYAVRINPDRTVADYTNGVAFQLTNDPAYAITTKIKSFSFVANDPLLANGSGVLWNLADTTYGGPGAVTGAGGPRSVWIRYTSIPTTNWAPVTNALDGSTLFNLNTCPNPLLTSYTPLGEASSTTNHELLSFYNPGPKDVGLLLSYFTYAAGSSTSNPNATQKGFMVRANGHLTVDPSTFEPNVHSIFVQSDGPIYAEQSTYTSTGLDALSFKTLPASNPITSTDKVWFFPDSFLNVGRTVSYDVFNPTVNSVNVTLTLVGATGNTLGTPTLVAVPSQGRKTLVLPTPPTGVTQVGARIDASDGVVATQTLSKASGSGYSTSLGQASALAKLNWTFPLITATNATGGFTGTLALWNQVASDAVVTFTFYAPNGGPSLQVRRLLGASRISIYSIDNLLHSNPGFDITEWQRGMLSIESTTNIFAHVVESSTSSLASMRGIVPASKWYIPDSPVGLLTGYFTGVTEKIYVANFGSTAVTVTIGVYDDQGNQLCTTNCTQVLPAHQRLDVTPASLGLGSITNKRLSFDIQATGNIAVSHSQSYGTNYGGDFRLVEAQSGP
ncbi:MAG: hypothetical protein WCS37_04890 [Chloroflexota bacterium]